ncbi:peptidyl-prolyl cis-trans isomerase [Flavobacteriaceae bacterium AU392]|nr:peptidyl-prolyl cis-trans isomerase [Flavobacteriaceae bacterium]RKM86819.1 peptidyl-prolyl cis-trans isomerase [Flavobacteriaceae bacterium AU392]
MKFKKIILLLTCLIVLSSCNFLKKETEEKPIARVNNSYLYFEDVEGLLVDDITKEDSLLRINNYINQWATKELLIAGAKFNLPEETQIEYDNLVNQYKEDLYIKAYLEALVKRSLDTIIDKAETVKVYNENIETFKLNEELIKFRYININENNEGVDEVERRFKRFNKEDKQILDSISIQFKSYSLNDSIWIRLDQAISKIPVITIDNKKELLKKSNFIQLKDSLGLYLMQVNEVLNRNEIAPIEYVMPTIKQIIINKRKLEFIKELEKDITKDAIKNKQFEIFK